MANSMLSLNVYRQKNRIIVQYYDSGSENLFVCPDCDRQLHHSEEEFIATCKEILCPNCFTVLAMISSQLPKNWLESRCI